MSRRDTFEDGRGGVIAQVVWPDTADGDVVTVELGVETARRKITAGEWAAFQAEQQQQAAERQRPTQRQRLRDALAANRTYLGVSGPTAAQNAAQIRALTRQQQTIIRLVLDLQGDVAALADEE